MNNQRILKVENEQEQQSIKMLQLGEKFDKSKKMFETLIKEAHDINFESRDMSLQVK